MKKLFLFLAFLSSSVFADCGQFVAWGYPAATNAIPLCQISYYTQWDPATKNPAYSAELLLEENVSGVENRKGTFKQHPSISTDLQATNDDYFKSGYDRGHMAAAGNMRKDSAAMEQSFYLTNMVPQVPILNRRFWASLEGSVRSKVTPERPLFVITGPIYSVPSKMIGHNVWVPTYTYKIIYDKTTNTVASYILPNDLAIKGKLTSFFVSLEKVESITKISYFPSMPPVFHTTLKQKPLEQW
jgi:endonuclease G